jgi:hypothetical protein
LFHADVSAKKLFWSSVQLDQKVLDALEQGKGKGKGLTVRIPTVHLLPSDVVVSRILLGTKPTDFVAAMSGQPSERITQVAEDLHEKGFHLDLQTN